MAIVVCTVISKNYLAYARVFANSFLKHHPDGKVFVLLVDRVDGYFDPRKEAFEVIEISELDIKDEKSFCFKYNVVELNTAVKPFFMKYLFNKFGVKKLVYFDPDILITHTLGALSEKLENYSIILTPHITHPIEDALRPYERIFLLKGSNNLGFIALANTLTTARFLDWWARRLYDYCLDRADEGFFVDQKWTELVPAIFGDVYLLREPGYNFAYWNLHERKLSVKNGNFYVNDESLYFYHFSGFVPEYPWLVSKYQSQFILRDLGILQKLFEQYRDLLYKNGYEETKSLPYAFGSFDNGLKITGHIRRLYYANLKRKNFGDPFDTRGKDSFFHWSQARARRQRFADRILGRLFRLPAIQRARHLIKPILYRLLNTLSRKELT